MTKPGTAHGAAEPGRVVIVTGASRGIGRCTAGEFAARGDRVVLAARSREALDAAVVEIRDAGGLAWAWAGDLRSAEACDELVGWTSAEVGDPDVVVLSAGVGHWTPTVDMTDEAWEETQQINVDSVFFLTRAALRRMLPRSTGHLVFVSSIMARRGVPNMSAYAASKAAIATLADSVAAEVKSSGVKTTVVYPGTTATTMRDHQVGRPLTPDITDPALQLSAEDVSQAVVWTTTLSDQAHVPALYLEPGGTGRRPHDIGGIGGAAREHIDRHERPQEDWEKLTDSIHQLMVAKGFRYHDQLRRVIESLDKPTYDRLSYFERRAAASESLLVESGVLTYEDIEQRAAAIGEQW